MNTPELVTNTRASLEWIPRPPKTRRGDIAWFSICALVGSVAVLYPFFDLGCLATAAALGICWLVVVHVRRVGLELWQVLLLIALTGEMVLNYGFDNLTIHVGGIPVIISYGLVYASLALAVVAHQRSLARALKEPAMLCVLALIVLALFHFVVDIPSYGLWAIRDASMFLDGIFMLLGLLWAMKKNGTVTLTKWLMAVFVLNMIYSLTLPWGERLWAWSPQSGVFLQVPLLGNYHGSGDQLIYGVLFCICLGGYFVRCPRWIMIFLTMAQLLGLAITQIRRMYLGIVIVLIILILLGETKKGTKLLAMLCSGIVVIFLVTAVGGLEISGRIGQVNMSFFKDHIRSISGAEDTPGSTVESRFSMVDEAMLHFRAHPVLGEGFGQPLLTEMDTNNPNGSVTRMPHNSSMSVLARLGVSGLVIWIALHLCLMMRFIYAFRQRRCCDKRLSDFVLWFFLVYLLFMMCSFVEAPFEFPASAVPFYFLTGFALGVMRWQLPQRANDDLVRS